MIQRSLHDSGLPVTLIVLTFLSIAGFCLQGDPAHGALLPDEQPQSTEQLSQWKSRRAPAKWVPVSAREDKPVATGMATDKTAKSPRDASKPSAASRKTPSMVFIAGKSAQESNSKDDLSLPSSDGPERSEKSQATPETSHPAAATKHNDTVQHDAADDTLISEHSEFQPHDHTDQPPGHAPMYFDAPILDSADLQADEPADGARIVSSTERVKQMLQRHAELQSSPKTGQSNQKTERLDTVEKRTISSLPPSIEADLRSEDPIRRERAKRFLKLREQLLQLKARAEPPTSSAAADTQSRPVRNGTTNENFSKDGSEPRHSGAHETTPTSDNKHPVTDGEYSDAGDDQVDHGDSNPRDTDHGDADPSEADHGDSAQPADAETDVIDTHPEHSADAHETALHEPGPTDHGSSQHDISADESSGSEVNSAETHDEMQDGQETAATDDAHLTAGAISDPIDRVSLGNNLYALGEYPAAHKAYLSVNPEEATSEQQFWTEYQIANCLRRMGENAEASNRFRKIAAQPEAGWLSERAAWWVSVLEQMRLAETSLASETASGQSKGATKPGLPISRSQQDLSHDNTRH